VAVDRSSAARHANQSTPSVARAIAKRTAARPLSRGDVAGHRPRGPERRPREDAGNPLQLREVATPDSSATAPLRIGPAKITTARTIVPTSSRPRRFPPRPVDRVAASRVAMTHVSTARTHGTATIAAPATAST
jgi:hypothetical protein